MSLFEAVLRAFAAAVASGDLDSAERLAALAFEVQEPAHA